MAPQRRASVHEAAALAGEQRAEENIEDLWDVVKHVKLFAKLSPVQQKALCRRMTIQTFTRDQHIVNVGDADDRLYAVLSGSVLVQTLQDGVLETTGTLTKGSCIGEAALQGDGGGSCGFALLAAERTEVLVTARADYDELAGPRQKQVIDQRVGFLRQCPQVEDALVSGQMTLQDLAAMADCLSEASCSGNEMVFQQGEVVEHIIFVRTGQLAMLRTVDPGSCHASKQLEPTMAGHKRHSDDPEQKRLLVTNLASAMCEIRARDRNKQLSSMLAVGGDGVRGAANANASLSARRSLGEAKPLPSHLAAQRAEQNGQQQGRLSPSRPSQSGPTSWRHVSQAHRQASILSNTVMPALGLAGIGNDAGRSARGGDGDRPGSKAQPRSARATASSWRSSTRDGGGPRVLRVGAIGAFQYFGDHQVWTGETYPVSLMSDPVVELYLVSKSDIMRRLPKRVVTSLFGLAKDELPTDHQLLQMQRQQERWSAFRRSMHAEAVSGRSRQASQAFRDASSGSRVDVAANLEFLGINVPDGNHAHSLTLPAPRKAVLTPKDEELFSQAPARFLRSLEGMRNDPGLRGALAREGRLRQRRRGDSPKDDDGMDASNFFFELHWSRLRFDPIELSLSEDTGEDLLPPKAASASAAAARPAAAAGRHGRTPRCQARSSPAWASSARPQELGAGSHDL